MVTITGNRLLGYGVDDNFQIQTTTPDADHHSLGRQAVAKATENVYLEGTLSPTGDVADTRREHPDGHPERRAIHLSAQRGHGQIALVHAQRP